MTMTQEKIKKTGYPDIDGLLLKKQLIFQENAELEKQIELAIKPLNPFFKRSNKKWINLFSNK